MARVTNSMPGSPKPVRSSTALLLLAPPLVPSPSSPDQPPTPLPLESWSPKSRKRGNLRKLKEFKNAFEKSWQLARNSDYWNAAVLNGIATTSILNSEPNLIMRLMEKGALCATISGNGPSIMAIADRKNKSRVQKEFSGLDGKIMISNINNKKAYVHEL